MDGGAGSQGTVKLLAVTFVVGTILGLAGMALWAALDGRDGNDGEDVATDAGRTGIAGELRPGDGATSTSPAPAADTRGARCADAAGALEAPLAAARPALRQWDVHVSAMNQLVVGEITLQQATRFWDRTRLGAQRNVERFRTAWRDVEREGVDCPAPDLMGPAPAAVRSCARLVEAELGVLRIARTSIDTWDETCGTWACSAWAGCRRRTPRRCGCRCGSGACGSSTTTGPPAGPLVCRRSAGSPPRRGEPLSAGA